MAPRTRKRMADSQDIKVAEALGRIEGKLDTFADQFTRHEARDEAVYANFTGKLDKLTASRDFAAGGWKMLSLIAATLTSLVMSLINFFHR